MFAFPLVRFRASGVASDRADCAPHVHAAAFPLRDQRGLSWQSAGARPCLAYEDDVRRYVARANGRPSLGLRPRLATAHATTQAHAQSDWDMIVSSRSRASTPSVDLVWLPLGAGGHSVRLNGRVFEAVAARLGRRPVSDLYHSALEVRLPEGRFVVELAPIPDGNGAGRGRRGRCRKPLGRTVPDFPLRGTPLARGCHSRSQRGGGQSTSTHGRSSSDATSVRPCVLRPDAGLGSR